MNFKDQKGKSMQVVTVGQALGQGRCIFVDARSPSEYEQGHIPGAYNVPLLEDDERAIVGTLYKQKGPETAKKKGLELVSAKLSAMVAQISALKDETPSATLVVYCWRGGMRSGSVLTVLGLMGIDACQLVGGYKAYRSFVQQQLRDFDLKPKVIVLCGSTGVGKTILLGRLSAMGLPVIDLEMLANHRGSAFGQVGRGKPATAQNFDAELLCLLQRYNGYPCLLVECESKRVGNVYLPDVLFQAMKTGSRILARASLPTRVNRLIAEYAGSLPAQDPEILGSLSSLTKRLGKKRVAQLAADYGAGLLVPFTSSLLEEYYDPLYGYEKADAGDYDLVVDAEDIEKASAEIAAYMEKFLERRLE